MPVVIPRSIDNFEIVYNCIPEGEEREHVKVFVVRTIGVNGTPFVMKCMRKTSVKHKFDVHKAEFEFMKTFCTDPIQRLLVHFFASYQNDVSVRTLNFYASDLIL